MQTTDEEDKESGDDGETDTDRESGETEVGGFNAFNWLCLINRVSERTKLDWEKIWELNVYTFMNYLQFDVQYRQMEEREIQRWKQTH